MNVPEDPDSITRWRSCSLLAGGMVVLLGLIVLCGWAFDVNSLKSVLPDYITMKTNTALLFLFSGLSLLLQPATVSGGKSSMLACAMFVLVVSTLTCIEQLTGMNFHIDEVLFSDPDTPLDLHPNRMAPTTAFNFILASSVILLTPKAFRSGYTATLVRALTACIFIIGVFGIVGYILDFEVLYNWFIYSDLHAYGAIAVHTAVGFTLLGTGLWALGQGGHWLQWVQSEDERITRISAVILVVAAGATGITGFVALQLEVERSYGEGLQVALDARTTQISTNLFRRYERSLIVTTRPVLLEHLQLLKAEPDNPAHRNVIQEELVSFVQHGITAITLSLPDGELIASTGELISTPAIRLPLDGLEGAEILWHKGLYLRNRIPVMSGQERLGELVTEQSLPNLTATLLKTESGRINTIEFYLCRTMPDAFHCLPTRLHPDPLYLPLQTEGSPLLVQMARVGENWGYAVTQDYRKHKVLGAFDYLEQLGLVAVLEIDTNEIYYPIGRKFILTLLLIAALTIAGTLLVRTQVRPLATALDRKVRERTADLEQMSESLRRSKAQIETIVENLDEGVVVSDLDGRLLHFNRAAIDMHGFTGPDEYLRHLPDFADTFELTGMDGTVLSVDQWPLARVLRGEQLHDMEIHIRHIRRDWLRIFSYGGTLVRNPEGDPIMAIITIRDITDRKQSEKRIEAQLVRFELLHQITRAIGDRLDLTSIFQVVIGNLEADMPIDFGCVCLYDEAGNHLTITSLGQKSAALAAQMGMVPGDDIPIDENGLSRCIQGHLVYEPDINQVRFDFPQRLVRGGLHSLVIAPLLVESRVFGILVVARYQEHGFTSPDCEFLGQLSGHVALASHQSQLYNALQQAYDDLRQTQQAIMQQERLRALGQMASGIAHDINNAISPVALYTESLLETEPNLSAKSRDYLETIQRSVEDVAQTVSRMREFYRQRETQLTLNAVTMNRVVEQVIDMTRARWSDIPQKQGLVIELNKDLDPDLPDIMGVESEIREALTNLIFNAIDAMPEGGTLTLRTRKMENATDGGANPSHVAVEVIDTGIGMDDQTRRRCLEPFYTTKGERGTGLGMAMVYGIMQRHSGDIEIESSRDQGTVVRLVFMVSTGITKEPVDDTRIMLTRLRLLVIDDDPLLIKSLRDILENDGHEVTVANGGQQGIEYFRAALEQDRPFAAVITDLGMPYVDGRKVAESIKAISSSTPVIMLTGWGQRLVAEGDVPEHVNCILNKPPRLHEIRNALAKYCRQSQA
jgi:signal transduction histidine kinase/PAS domain-containing protein/ActR/RegA family two-component response regulator